MNEAVTTHPPDVDATLLALLGDDILREMLLPPRVPSFATVTRAPAKWQKECRCGVSYTHAAWQRLPYVGLQDDFDGGWLEMRNCVCHSTLCVRVGAPR